MNEDLEIQIYRLRSRISELEARLDQPKNWTNGELGIFRQQIYSLRAKLKLHQAELHD